MLQRIIGVLKLDVNTFEEIEHDSNATGQAAIVVLIVSLVAAIGSGAGASIGGGSFLTSFLTTLIWTFIGWVIWSAVTYFVGTSIFHGQADMGEMLRVIGFAYAPQILGIIPCIGWIVGAVWTLVAGFIAIRQGLDLDNTKTFLTIVIGFLVYIVGAIIVGFVVGGVSAIGSSLG
jgi:hypothetical protein